MFKILIFVFIWASLYLAYGKPASKVPFKESDEIGTTCECDSGKAWLDIVVVMDRSSVMGKDQISEASAQLLTLLYDFTIGQEQGKNTRIGIVSFASSARIEADLTKFENFTALETTLVNLLQVVDENDQVVDVEAGLRTALELVKSSKIHGPPVILLLTSAASVLNTRNPIKMANLINQGGVKIITIDYSNGVIADFLVNLATPGMNFPIDVKTEDLKMALCQANCVCPSFTAQFKTSNNNSKKLTYYADCLHGDSKATTQQGAQQICASQNNGVLVSITNQEKLKFIQEKVVPAYVGNSQSYWIGLHQNPQNLLVWYDYHQNELLLTNFTNWIPMPASSKASFDCVRARGIEEGSKWSGGGCDEYLGYVCQTRACDSTHPCVMTSDYTIF